MIPEWYTRQIDVILISTIQVVFDTVITVYIPW